MARARHFSRGLNGQFLDALNQEYDDPSGWWRRIVDDEDLYIGIRENYINVYFDGGSILELRHRKGKGFYGKTHFKYLLNLTREHKSKDYVKFKNGTFDDVSISDPYTEIARDLAKIKKAAKGYQGEEKIGVHQISIQAKNVIDVEVQIPGFNSRLDFAALQEIDGKNEVAFFEAKTYTNGDLRSKTEHPEVLEQIKRYDSVLSESCGDIKESYVQVARNINEMRGWNNRRRDNIFSEASKGNISVNPEVRLVIFGFDESQKNAANSPEGIFINLKDALGPHRVLATGKPQDLAKRISSPK